MKASISFNKSANISKAKNVNAPNARIFKSCAYTGFSIDSKSVSNKATVIPIPPTVKTVVNSKLIPPRVISGYHANFNASDQY